MKPDGRMEGDYFRERKNLEMKAEGNYPKRCPSKQDEDNRCRRLGI
jgi:hypothetical protein